MHYLPEETPLLVSASTITSEKNNKIAPRKRSASIQSDPTTSAELSRQASRCSHVSSTQSSYTGEVIIPFENDAFQLKHSHTETNISSRPRSVSVGRRTLEGIPKISSSPDSTFGEFEAQMFSSEDSIPYVKERKRSISLVLDPDFDITPVHLIKLFNTLDHDHTGRISYSQMRDGISGVSKSFSDNVKMDLLNKLLEEIDHDKSHDITQSEFVSAVQEYAARALSKSGGKSECFCFDYGPEKAFCLWVDSSGEHTQYGAGTPNMTMGEFQNMDEKLPIDTTVRWIGIKGNDMSLFLRICNKYKIHPLQMEDVLQGKERPKVESFGDGNMHIVIGHVSLKRKDDDIFMKVKVHQMNIFMIDKKTVLSFMKKEPLDINQSIMSRIMYSGSKLRLCDSRYLIYTLVDSVVDRVYPITKFFNTSLKALQAKVQSDETTKLETIKKIQQIYREVNVLLFWLRPISNVVLRLMDELPGDDADMRHHLEDLRDHVVMLTEQSLNIATWARSLNEDYRNEQAHRMSEVMYVLTLVTTIFIPAQFLTGVFGMNFKFMPEMEFKYSYLLFWAVVVILSSSSFCFFKWKGWLKL